MNNSYQKGFTLWFTGLPCSGKTSLAKAVGKRLSGSGHCVEILDGDVIRKKLWNDLGFSRQDRTTNIERVAFLASLLTKNGAATLISFVSPYRSMRQRARKQIGSFVEIHVDCPLSVCEKRDVKGMYKKARAGKIREFTGISDPYEPPRKPEIRVSTDAMNIRQCADKIMGYLRQNHFLVPENPFPKNPFLSKAFELAAFHHRGQERKGGLPYIVHPVAVAKTLQKLGYSDDVVAAGLLHDVLEDTGCEVEELERKINPKVARIVCEVTDRDKTVSWKVRKKNYLKGLKTNSKEALSVACADKVDNLTSLLEGGRLLGKKFLNSFSGKILEKHKNYRNIYNVIQSKHSSCPLLPVYKEKLEQIKKIAHQKDPR